MRIFLRIIFFILVAGASVSCKKDHEQYIYTDREVITVSGLENSYSKTSAVDRLVVKPLVSSNKPGELDYLWGVYPANVQLTRATMDTIARSKELDFPVNLTADNWNLVFRVTNLKTGYEQYFTSTLHVGTQFTRGWYVLKDANEGGDLDLFLTPETIKPASSVRNVFSAINGRKLAGEGMALRFNSFYKSESASGSFDNTRSLFIVTDEDASVVRVNDLAEIRDISDLAFGGLEVKKPMMVGNDFLTFFMINNGQLHSMIGQGPSFGQFGGAKMKNSNGDPYFLSKYHLMHIASFFFDEMSSSFFSASDRGLNLTAVRDNPASQLTANNNNKKLVYMAMKNRTPYSGVAIFQDKTDESVKTLAEVFPLVAAFRMMTQPIQPTDKIYNGSNFGLLYQDENLIYFSVGTEVWSRNISNRFEQLQYTLPADETVTFIQHRKNMGVGTEAAFSHNYVVVGSVTSNGKYKVRMFTKTSGNLSQEPEFTLEGDGKPRDVIYISPAISSGATSFPDTY